MSRVPDSTVTRVLLFTDIFDIELLVLRYLMKKEQKKREKKKYVIDYLKQREKCNSIHKNVTFKIIFLFLLNAIVTRVYIKLQSFRNAN